MSSSVKRVCVFVISAACFTLFPSSAQASPLFHSSYQYDSTGNIKTIEDKISPSNSQNFTYDDVYRLQGAQGGYTASYTYNNDGNILTKTEGTSTINETYTPTDTVASHGPKSVNGKSLLYDQNGNLIEDSFSNLKIVYDLENRPVEIWKLDSNTLLAKYYYDGEGRRVKKEVYTNGALSSTTYYVNQYYEKEIPSNGTPKIRKFYSGVAYKEGDTLTYTLSDHLSSTSLTTNSQGQKLNEYKYYPYGSPIINSQLTTNNLPPNSWIGQRLDPESNLYFLNARYYSPIYGRFIQSDMVNDPATRGNKYSYVGENPVSRGDPSGQTCISDVEYVCENIIQYKINSLSVNIFGNYDTGSIKGIIKWAQAIPQWLTQSARIKTVNFRHVQDKEDYMTGINVSTQYGVILIENHQDVVAGQTYEQDFGYTHEFFHAYPRTVDSYWSDPTRKKFREILKIYGISFKDNELQNSLDPVRAATNKEQEFLSYIGMGGMNPEEVWANSATLALFYSDYLKKKYPELEKWFRGEIFRGFHVSKPFNTAFINGQEIESNGTENIEMDPIINKGKHSIQ